MIQMGEIIKKYKWVFLIAGIAIAALIVILVATNNRKKDSDGSVSRYEWIQMLAEKFYMNEYQETEPYYYDVPADDPYYTAVQSAYEWGVTPKEEKFEGNKTATGEYIALTAMRAIGKYKVQIYLGLTEEPTEEQYLQLSDEMGLVARSQARDTFTKEQCDEILDRAKEMFLDDLWVDDYVKVDYQESTVILSEEDFQELPENERTLKLTKEASEDLGVGTIIVYPDKNGVMAAGEVAEISKDGNVTVTDADYTEVVQSMILSDIESVTVDDFLEAYGIDRSEGTPLDDADLKLLSSDTAQENFELLTWTQEIPLMNNPGFTFIVQGDLDQGNFGVELVDNATDTKFDIPINGKQSDETGNSVAVAVGVKNILVGAQTVGNGLVPNYNDPDYIDVRCSSDVEIKGEAKFHVEKEIPLQAITLHLGKDAKGNSLFAIDLGFFLKFEADGTIELKVAFPQNASVVYEKNVGIRYPQFNIGDPTAELKADCDVGAYLEFKAMLEILKHKLIDFSIEGGVLAKATVTLRTNSDITTCIGVDVYFPVAQIEFGVDVVVFEVKQEFPILSPENAPIHFGVHVEKHKDGTVIVTKPPVCTYKEEAKANNDDKLLPGVYIMEVHEDPITAKGKCEVTGNLYIYDAIPRETLEKMQTGDVYELYDHEFTYEGMGKRSELPPGNENMLSVPDGDIYDEDIYKFHDQNDNIYFVIKESYIPYGNAYNEIAELNRMEDRIEPIYLHVYYQESDGNTSSSGATTYQCMTLAKEDYRIVLNDMTGTGAKALELTDDNYITFVYYPSVNVADCSIGFGTKEMAEKQAIDISLGWVDGRHYEYDDIQKTWQ